MRKGTLCLLLLAALLIPGGCSVRIGQGETPEAAETAAVPAPETPEAGERADVPDPGEPEPLVMEYIEYHSFEEAVSRCTDVLTGICLEEEEAGGMLRYAFSVGERLKGGTEAEEICVVVQRAYVDATEHSAAYIRGERSYVPGTRYLLVLERSRSVYWDADRYVPLGDVVLPLEDPRTARMYDAPLEDHWACGETDDPETVTAYVRRLIEEDRSPRREVWGAPFIEAQSFEEAEAAAELVLLVRTDALMITGRVAPTETWACRILDSRKGDLDYLEGNMDVLVTFFAGTVETGREYWICVNKPDETSRIFVLASKENSVREAEKAV